MRTELPGELDRGDFGDFACRDHEVAARAGARGREHEFAAVGEDRDRSPPRFDRPGEARRVDEDHRRVERRVGADGDRAGFIDDARDQFGFEFAFFHFFVEARHRVGEIGFVGP